jgi:hypothetical protein
MLSHGWSPGQGLDGWPSPCDALDRAFGAIKCWAGTGRGSPGYSGLTLNVQTTNDYRTSCDVLSWSWSVGAAVLEFTT